jgi:hypothetical protein
MRSLTTRLPEKSNRRMTMDKETIETLLALLNPLHGSLDKQPA